MGMKRFLPFVKSDPFVAVIRLQGAIANSRAGLDNPSLAPVIEKAFSKGKPAAVALEINCPGGSPVQSSLIAARIRRLAALEPAGDAGTGAGLLALGATSSGLATSSRDAATDADAPLLGAGRRLQVMELHASASSFFLVAAFAGGAAATSSKSTR